MSLSDRSISYCSAAGKADVSGVVSLANAQVRLLWDMKKTNPGLLRWTMECLMGRKT